MNNMKNKNITTKNTKSAPKVKSESGLGWDSVLKQFYTINYAWEYLVDNLKKSKTRDIKSGITGGTSAKEALNGLSTRYKVYSTNILWEDRKLLPKGTTKKEAETIVRMMDISFKYSAENEKKWQKRRTTGIKELGTEVYVVDSNNGLNEIIELWEESFTQSCLSILGKKAKFDLGNYAVTGEWGIHLDEFNEWYKRNLKGRFIATTGYGKGYIAWLFLYLSTKCKNLPIKVVYTDSISNNRQAAKTHTEKYDKGMRKIVLVCTEGVLKTMYGDIQMYLSGNKKLKSIILNAMRYKDEVTFYVNRHSAGGFNELFNKCIDVTGYDLEIPIVIDESQNFTGNELLKTVKALSNPIKNSIQLGITATEERRDDTDARTNIIKNDDEEFWGEVIREINVLEAISLGRHSPVDFLTLVISNNDEISQIVLKNEAVVLKLGKKKDIIVRGRLMRTLASIAYVIKKHPKNKIGIVCSLKGDANDAIDCLHIMQIQGIIPKKYKIVNAIREFKDDAIQQIEDNDYVIYVGTPWMCTGLDLPTSECGIASYDFGIRRVGRQWVGRHTRTTKSNPNKRALIVIALDVNDTTIPNMMYVKEDMENNRNTHGNSKVSDKKTKTTFGSRIKKVITHTMVKPSSLEPEDEFFWSEIENAINENTLSSIQLNRITKKYVLKQLENYKSLVELTTKNESLYYSIYNQYNINEIDAWFTDLYSDYSKLPSTTIDDLKQYVTKKWKSYNVGEPILRMIRTKHNFITTINK
jgi:superfamily II DNA or RNA helicase